MKVLHVIPSISTSDGGPSRAMAEIEHALADVGIQCTTVTTDAGLPSSSVPLGVPVETAHAIRWYFPLTTCVYKTSAALLRWLTRNIGDYHLVHVHALFSFAPVAAATLARRSHKPYVIRPIGVLSRYGMHERRAMLKKLSFSVLERPLIESAGAIHFTSVMEQEEANHLGVPFRGKIIPLGIDFSAVLPALNDSAERVRSPKLLFLSRIDAVKNIEGLLRAFALIRPGFQNLTLDIAGEGSEHYVGQLKSEAAKLGIDRAIRWHGYVEGEQKQDLLANATVFVLPSFSESFGIAAVEALAAGIPCILSNKAALSQEIAAVGAGVVVSSDPEGIADGIRRILRDAAAYAAMRHAAATLARESFSLSAMGRRLDALYRDLSAGPI